MTKFRNNETNILLATEIALGIDVRNACFVINVGPPKISEKDTDIDLEKYLHRMRFMGRHNDRGIALTWVEKHVLSRLLDCMRRIHKIEINEMKDQSVLADEVIECIRFNSS
jgi:superfamily II DNA/RNA helicase